MVTGDNIETALSIAYESGMVNNDCVIETKESLFSSNGIHETNDIAMTGKEFSSLDDHEVDQILNRYGTGVFRCCFKNNRRRRKEV